LTKEEHNRLNNDFMLRNLGKSFDLSPNTKKLNQILELASDPATSRIMDTSANVTARQGKEHFNLIVDSS